VHGRGFESLIQSVQSSTPYFTDPYTVSSQSELHLLYGSPISRWFISSMDPFYGYEGIGINAVDTPY
jgi:hypothetical protein